MLLHLQCGRLGELGILLQVHFDALRLVDVAILNLVQEASELALEHLNALVELLQLSSVVVLRSLCILLGPLAILLEVDQQIFDIVHALIIWLPIDYLLLNFENAVFHLGVRVHELNVLFLRPEHLGAQHIVLVQYLLSLLALLLRCAIVMAFEELDVVDQIRFNQCTFIVQRVQQLVHRALQNEEGCVHAVQWQALGLR